MNLLYYYLMDIRIVSSFFLRKVNFWIIDD